MKNNSLDNKTAILVKELKNKLKLNKLNEIDKKWLYALSNGTKTIQDIEEERNKCKESWLYFINEYVQVKNKFDNPDTMPDILKERCLGDMIKFVLYDIQVDLATAIFNDDKVISTKSRQIGFTTTALCCSLQLLTFQNNKTVLLYSKTEKDTIEALSELKFMLDSLPFFLRRTEMKRNEKQLALGNRRNSSKIIAQTSGKQSGRSQSATWLICDEADYIEGIESIYKAALFTISATKGKMIILSTPNLYGSQFQRMVTHARNKGFEGSGFRLIEGAWHTIPYRDQMWYDEQCKLLNNDKKAIHTELDMKWILPHETYFSDERLMRIEGQQEIEIICNCIKQYYKKNKNDDYLIAVDVQEEGSHFNAIVVQNLMQRRIEATCLTRQNPYEQLIELSKYYKNESNNQRAKIMIERNRGYYLIKKFEENDLNELLLPNIHYIRKTDSYEFDLDKDGKPMKLGFVTTESTRKKALIILSNYLYKTDMIPLDLLDEALKFVIKSRGKPVGLEHDDLLMATAICIFTVEILDQYKVKQAGSKRILNFLKLYQKQSKNPHNSKMEQHKEDIDAQIAATVNKKFLLINDFSTKNYELEMLEMYEKNNTHSSKMNKALMGLYQHSK